MRVETDSGGHTYRVVHRTLAAADDGGGQISDDSHNELATSIAKLCEVHRQHQDLQRAEMRLNLQIQAIGRRLQAGGGEGQRGDGTQKNPALIADFAALHLIEAREMLLPYAKHLKRQMEKMGKQLPCWEWVESVRGVSEFGYAQIIAETGDLTNYANPAKVWKRMGLAVIQGQRQRRVKDKELAIEMGYDAHRHAMMKLVGDHLIMSKDPRYREIYDTYKARIIAEFEAGDRPDLAHKDGTRNVGHTDNMAKRYIAKKFLKHLWQEWRRATVGVTPIDYLPAPLPEAAD